MGVVHGLQGNARVIAVEVAVLDEIFDRIDDLFEPCTRISRSGIKRDKLETTYRSACSRRASSILIGDAKNWAGDRVR